MDLVGTRLKDSAKYVFRWLYLQDERTRAKISRYIKIAKNAGLFTKGPVPLPGYTYIFTLIGC